METYATELSNMPLIRRIFHGYIFRRVENGKGYVKCSLNQKKKIESFGIILN